MTEIKTQQRNAILLCVSVAIVWGLGFIFNPMALASGLTPSMVCLLRFAIAAVVYGVVFHKKIKIKLSDLKYGAFCGLALFTGFLLLTVGQEKVTPSTSAFIASLATVILPFAEWIFFKQKPTVFVYISLGIYLCGVTILCFANTTGAIGIGLGELFTLISALGFAMQFISISIGLKKVGYQTLNFLQMSFATVFFAVYFLLFDLKRQIATPIIFDQTILPILGMALLSTFYAYSVQTYSQRILPPYQVSIILSQETVSAVILSVALGYDKLFWNTIVGGVLMILAVILAELAPRISLRKHKKLVKIPKKIDTAIEDKRVATDTKLPSQDTSVSVDDSTEKNDETVADQQSNDNEQTKD